MKVLYVHGDDYSALQFEREMKEDVAEMWEKASLEKSRTYVHEELGIEFDAYEFEGTVSKEFVDFIRNEIQDYDDSKHSNFYILESENK